MTEITRYLVDNLVLVYFVYGLSFFGLGLVLTLSCSRTADLRFMMAIRPLAGFGYLHGIHEWIDMFQLIRRQTTGIPPSVTEEVIRHILLAGSFSLLLAFAAVLLERKNSVGRRTLIIEGVPLLLWGMSAISVLQQPGLDAPTQLAQIEVLARYFLGMPGAILAGLALLAQQRAFREAKIGQFGRDLVWCATAFLLYGLVGQLFVRSTALWPSRIVNSDLFLAWFGFPVQLFRATMAIGVAVFMMRIMLSFELTNVRRLDAAHRAEMDAQERALALERRAREVEERHADELRRQARELALLLELSNQLALPEELSTRLGQALRQVVNNLPFSDAGMILLTVRPAAIPAIAAVTGFHAVGNQWVDAGAAESLGQACIDLRLAVCDHEDGARISFDLDGVLVGEDCWHYPSPTTTIALPLASRDSLLGAVVLARARSNFTMLELADLRLLAGIAQQMALSIENGRLYQEAQAREKLLADLHFQVVRAQEAERQRIARDLHDATGQSLTAIALALRGYEASLAEKGSGAQRDLSTIRTFANDALTELRRIIADLRPPQLDDFGLAPALRWYVGTFQERHPGLTVQLRLPRTMPRLAQEVETLLFRIVQEGLTNVAKHAVALSVVVDVQTCEDSLCIEIEDDGRGFDVDAVWANAQTGWGLLGIRERTQLLGGTVTIESEIGQGTRVRVQIPITPAR
jgi:signal transduction histidine kinase